MIKSNDTNKRKIIKCLLIGACVLSIFAGVVMLKYGFQPIRLFGLDALPFAFLGCGVIAILQGGIGIIKVKGS